MGLTDHIVKRTGPIFTRGDLIVHKEAFRSESRDVRNVKQDDIKPTTLSPYTSCSRLTSKVGPGDPAAHRTGCLPLLPSGPGGVHRILLHRAQPLFSIFSILGSPIQSALKVCIRPQ